MAARKGLEYALILAGALTIAAPALAVCDSTQPSRTPTSRYEIRGGEVYDKETDLTWQRCSVGQRWNEEIGCVGVIRQMTWKEAMSQAANGWRVPTKDELATLIAPGCRNPAINEEVFPDMELGKLWYWTSTENGATVWYVAFGGGTVQGNGGPLSAHAVRLVRSGR